MTSFGSERSGRRVEGGGGQVDSDVYSSFLLTKLSLLVTKLTFHNGSKKNSRVRYCRPVLPNGSIEMN